MEQKNKLPYRKKICVVKKAVRLEILETHITNELTIRTVVLDDKLVTVAKLTTRLKLYEFIDLAKEHNATVLVLENEPLVKAMMNHILKKKKIDPQIGRIKVILTERDGISCIDEEMYKHASTCPQADRDILVRETTRTLN